MNTPTPEQIAKLPKWAQDNIADLKRQRSEAVRTLNQFQDNDTPSFFYWEEHACTGEQSGPQRKTRYIQGHVIHVKAHGVHVSIIVRDEWKAVEIQYDSDRNSCTEVALIPESFQKFRIVAQQNMRP